MFISLKLLSNFFTDYKRRARSRRVARSPFYLRHPYSGPVSLASLDSRVAIDFDLGFLYNRVLKAANTTIIATLASWRGEVGGHPKALFRRPSELNPHEVQMTPALFKFTFVRNPYTRTLSAYLDKISRGKRKPLELAKKSGRTPSFEDFCIFLERGGLYDNLHWAPQASALLLPLEDFDFIGHTESLGSGLDSVRKRIRIETGTSGTVDRRLHSTNANALIREHYTSRCQRIIRTLYQEDFTQFGYSFSLPAVESVRN